MRLQFSIIFLLFLLNAFSQSAQEKYLSAKNTFKNENYSGASLLFSSLANDDVFGEYATFYFALSEYYLGNKQKALDGWRQILARNLSFDQKDEVNYWLVRAAFELGDFRNGLIRSNQLTTDERKVLIEDNLGSLPYDRLLGLFDEFSNDKELASVLVRVGLTTELSQEQKFQLEGIKSRLGITTADLTDYPVIKKSQYNVAVMLPFFFDGYDKPDRIISNTVIMDLYFGMSLAETMLNESGIGVKLFPFDTQRDTTQTKILLRSGRLGDVDAIVGPLFPEPVSIVSKFSVDEEINLIHPLSSNLSLMDGNPYGFILKPDHETQAVEAARYMATTASKSEVNIYYEDKEPEKLVAKKYRSEIEKWGMKIKEFSTIDSRTARQVLAKFSNQEEVLLHITESEADALRAKGRLIRDRQVYDASGRQVLNADGTPKMEYYEMEFTAETDSLDHIFAVTKSNLLANNLVGAVESIVDTVRLLGMGEWLEFTMLDYRQLERLGINLIHPDLKNRKSEFYQKVVTRFEAEYGKSPGNLALQGFESIWWLGNMMNMYGKYFQNGFIAENEIETLFSGHRFVSGRNDNSTVPIVRFEDQELKTINIGNEQDEE